MGGKFAIMASPFRSVFGKLEIRLDPWQPEFGPEFSGMVDASASAQDSVDAQLERPAATWGAVDPTGRLSATVDNFHRWRPPIGGTSDSEGRWAFPLWCIRLLRSGMRAAQQPGSVIRAIRHGTGLCTIANRSARRSDDSRLVPRPDIGACIGLNGELADGGLCPCPCTTASRVRIATPCRNKIAD